MRTRLQLEVNLGRVVWSEVLSNSFVSCFILLQWGFAARTPNDGYREFQRLDFVCCVLFGSGRKKNREELCQPQC